MKASSVFCDRYGPWALVTGAAEGLGAEFARQLAGRGLNLVLVDRQPDPLRDVARELEQATGAQVRTVVTDLAQRDFLPRLEQTTADLEVGLLISCAAVSPLGPLLDLDLEAQLAALRSNCEAPLSLAHAYGQAMRRRRRGGILLVSSLSALQGTPLVATYAATKAFNLVLAESLWAELREHDVHVLAVLPGPTATPGYWASAPQTDGLAARLVMSSGDVVTDALDALGGSPTRVSGPWNRLSAFVLGRLLPRRLAVSFIAGQMRKLYPHR